MSSRASVPRKAARLIRPLVRVLRAYVPGEQPKISGLIKLNTNENPYPPSPKVYRALKGAMDERLRLYPDPEARALRERVARYHRCRPENVIVGNGSDELLALATRAFVEPAGPGISQARSRVQYFQPSYSLYPVLAGIHGAEGHAQSLGPNFELPSVAVLRKGGQWRFDAALTFVTTPNAPSGQGYSTPQLEALVRAHRGVVVLDEAYVDFAREDALRLALDYPQVLVSRTFSKAFALCFLRVGYFIGHPELITALDKVRDSYNVNGLGQVAALAALEDKSYYQRQFRRIRQSRARLGKALARLGFEVYPSQTNFVLVRPPMLSAERWLAEWRSRKILVRWFRGPGLSDYLRITVGTEAEVEALLRAAREILGS